MLVKGIDGVGDENEEPMVQDSPVLPAWDGILKQRCKKNELIVFFM